MDYKEFLETKKHTSVDYGIKPIWFPDNMFDFQKHVTELGLIKGRFAELKTSYFKQSIRNLADVKSRFESNKQQKLF